MATLAAATGDNRPEDTQNIVKPAIGEPGGGNVDKIRDILFGPQMRDYETRFARLEETLARESANLRDNTKKKFEALEAYIRSEMEALQTRIKSERDERSDSLRRLTSELRELNDSLSKRIGELDDQTSRAQGDLRNQILQQSKDLSDDMRAKQEEGALLVEKRFQELRNLKTDRAMLAGLLTEVALRLKDEFQVPGAEG
jgi:DNA anti-recombination protein RmuC